MPHSHPWCRFRATASSHPQNSHRSFCGVHGCCAAPRHKSQSYRLTDTISTRLLLGGSGRTTTTIHAGEMDGSCVRKGTSICCIAGAVFAIRTRWLEFGEREIGRTYAIGLGVCVRLCAMYDFIILAGNIEEERVFCRLAG